MTSQYTYEDLITALEDWMRQNYGGQHCEYCWLWRESYEFTLKSSNVEVVKRGTSWEQALERALIEAGALAEPSEAANG